MVVDRKGQKNIDAASSLRTVLYFAKSSSQRAYEQKNKGGSQIKGTPEQ